MRLKEPNRVGHAQRPIRLEGYRVAIPRNQFVFLLLLTVLLLALIQSGCVGLTSADPALAIIAQPASNKVNPGQVATFSVGVSGRPPFDFQWRKNGTAISGATSSTYTTPVTTSADNGAKFTVVVNNSAGSAASDAATLTVTSSPIAPSIITQPAGQTVSASQPATFLVAASGTAQLSYQWQKNGTVISGATSATYTTSATTISDSGSQFSAVVSNSTGSVTSNTATLTVTAAVTPPTITTQPVSQTITAGQATTFSVASMGTMPLSYQWQKNGTAISGATSASYTTPATTISDSGSPFTVTVSNSAGSVTSNAATLTVNAAAVAPSITTQPTSQTVTAGQPATFSVTASGTAPLSYLWRKSGTAISGATSATYTTPATATSDSGSQFSVLVSNSTGSVTSNTATLTVNAAILAPSITTQPTSQTVTAGQAATFSVAASGTAPLSYQWQKNGTAISGATSATYTTPATATSDGGSQFSVLVSNSTGSVTSNTATLTVNAATLAPSITTQPTSQTVTASQPATFSVAASGTAPLSYQWQKNGTAISGATSSGYTTPVTISADSGSQFAVAVSNSSGTVTSSTAILTVKAAGQLTASPTNLSYGNVTVGSSSILSVTLSNMGGTSVSISNLTLSGAGLSASGVSSGLTIAAGSSATLNVTFAPSASGTLNGSVTITSNATNSTVTISLLGTAVQPVSHSVTLSLAANSSNVAGYNVYRSSISNGPYTKLNSPPFTSTTYTDSTVLASQTYFYVATSVDSAGNEAAYSNQVSATIPTP
jgi:hypothetical protein